MHGRDIWDDIFCRWPAIISKSSELSIYYIIKVSQPKVHHVSVTIKGAAGEFLRRGFEFYRGWLVWQIYLHLPRHLTENDFQCQKGGGSRVNHMKPLWNRQRSVTLKSTARSNINKRTASDCHKQRYCQGLPKTKYCQRVKQSKVLPRSAAI